MREKPCLTNNVLINNTTTADTVGTSSSSNPINPSSYFLAASMGNTVDSLLSGAMLTNLSLGASFNPTPTGGPALTGASFTSSKLSGLETVTYRGAVGAGGTWFTGWTKW